MSLTNPPSPILVGGETYSNWRQEDNAYILDDVSSTVAYDFMVSLGQRIPGKLEDGTDVLWHVTSVGHPTVDPADNRVVLVPDLFRTKLTFSFAMAEGHILSPEAARGLYGQWFTILIFGAAVLARVIEVERQDDGKRVTLTAETDWSGATPTPKD